MGKLLQDAGLSKYDYDVINKKVNESILDQLYGELLAGVGFGVVTTIIFGIAIAKYTSARYLTAWYGCFSLMFLSGIILYFAYRKNKTRFSQRVWWFFQGYVFMGSALLWGSTVLFAPPTNLIGITLVICTLLGVAASLAQGAVGYVTIAKYVVAGIMLPPVAFLVHLAVSQFSAVHQLSASGHIMTLLSQESDYFKLSCICILYMLFHIQANKRNSDLLVESEKFNIAKTYDTYQSKHDSVTDLPNERLLFEYIDEAIKSVHVSGKKFGLIYFYINRIESISNTIGHNKADLIVLEVAERFKDVIAQLSFERPGIYKLSLLWTNIFAVLICPVDDREITDIIHQAQEALSVPVRVADVNFNLTACVGACLYPQYASGVESLVTNTDLALFHAKAEGGNTVVFYREEMRESREKNLKIANYLESALASNQFNIVYQPIVDIKKDKIHGVESLIRWKHPELGFISPDIFIAIAEETGIICQIDLWVLDQVCAQMRIWQKMGFKWLNVAVNLSGKNFKADTIQKYIQTIVKADIDISKLNIEITENVAFDEDIDFEQAQNFIKALKGCGVKIAMDDFGKGHSNWFNLNALHVDKLKIDKAFVQNLESSATRDAISSIIAYAKKQNILIVAEGVETERQLEFLKKSDCDCVQGYYYSKPISADELKKYIVKNAMGTSEQPLTIA